MKVIPKTLISLFLLFFVVACNSKQSTDELFTILVNIDEDAELKLSDIAEDVKSIYPRLSIS